MSFSWFLRMESHILLTDGDESLIYAPPLPTVVSLEYDLSGCSDFASHVRNPGSLKLGGPRGARLNDIEIPPIFHFIHYGGKFKKAFYMCSVESAARQNPRHTVFVHTSNALDFETNIANWRVSVGRAVSDRVKSIALDMDEVFSGTPIQGWWQRDEYTTGQFGQQQVGNALRLALLWKYGGVYADMDIISINSVDGMGRSIAADDKSMINNAFLSFPQNDPFMMVLMEVFVRDYNADVWGFNGPWLVTKVYNGLCRVDARTDQKGDVVNGVSETSAENARASCRNLTVAAPYRFHLVHTDDRETLYENWSKSCGILRDMASTSVGVHAWKRFPVGAKVPKDSLIVKIMDDACPAVSKVFSDQQLGRIDEPIVPQNIAGYDYVGCIEQGPLNQLTTILSTIQETKVMSLGRCAHLAKKRNFGMFGVVGGVDCFGAKLHTVVAHTSEQCTHHCLGNVSEYCGGRGTMSVYAIPATTVFTTA
ncbi:Lactosylceramide 4-alpha-galactosyltransferase [Entophlyctis luteolus]|nr:Lactosylceramide 4-alpha-galactosyltransferase [Entophlyctis luteolus]